MRTLALALVLAAALAGCSGGGGDPYFPKESKLPDGWTYASGPEDAAASERGRSGAESMRVAGLAGPGGATASIVVLEFDDERVAAAIEDDPPCDGTDIHRALRDGDTVVFLGIGGASATAAVRALADTIADRSGARVIC